MDKYIIAIRRESRATAPTDWVEFLRGIPGLHLASSANPTRIQVEASPEAIEDARRRVGQFAYIEPVMLHSRA